MIFSSLLMEVTFWLIEEGYQSVKLEMEGDHVKATSGTAVKSFKVDMRLSEQRAQITPNFRTMVAVHEAGHAVVYALLHKCAPFEVKVNVASFTGGYMATAVASPYKIETKAALRASLSVLFAGRCAEELVFGEDNASNGAESDFSAATNTASAYVRKWGFDRYTARIESGKAERISWVTRIEETDSRILGLLERAHNEARGLIEQNKAYFSVVVNALLEKGVLTQAEFIELSKPFIAIGTEEVIADHGEKWAEFCANSL
jgi:cell division protease FtsH